MSVIDDIKSRIDIVELISETVKLRKSGRAFTGLCPFHAHRNNTPSFAVWPDSGNWRCFGQCNEGGDAFKFVMKRDGVDFPEALRLLAGRAGVELTPRTPETQAQDDHLDHLRQLLEAAATYYQHLLKNAPQAQTARGHVAHRGLTDQAVELFQLGYALEAWDAALNYFTGKGYAQQDLLDAGLIVVKEDGKVFDRFRDRLMIPVRDDRGRMTGFQARALNPEVAPKFMNSPQTALFDKGRILFGLHLARKAIRQAETAVVVEGNLDVIAAHQAGLANVVSSQGTALTEHQLRLLKKHARRIILALDADEAGGAATLRGLSVARAALDREAEITFDPRGLVKIEGRLGADIRVMTLPAGQDPDDVIRHSAETWRELVDAAEPVVEYVMRVLAQGRDLNDPKVKTEIAETVLPLIEDVGQPTERETYRQKLMRVLRLDEKEMDGVRLRLRSTAPTRSRRVQAPEESPPAASGAGQVKTAAAAELAPEASALEMYCVGALLRRPELLYKADRELQALGLPKLAADDFLQTEHQAFFRVLGAALDQVESDPTDYVRQNADPALRLYLEAALKRESEATMPPDLAKQMVGIKVREPDDAKRADDLVAAILRLRRATLSRWLKELRFLAEDARDQGDAPAETYTQEIARYGSAVDQITRAVAARSKRGPIRLQRTGMR